MNDLTTKQAAVYLGISHYYLRNMRQGLHEHQGPKFRVGDSKQGFTCYYTISDLDAWKTSHKWKNPKLSIISDKNCQNNMGQS